jgi:uncharacterized membrane protein (UPF0127 family)
VVAERIPGKALVFALSLLAAADAGARARAQDAPPADCHAQALRTEPLAIRTGHGWVRFTVEVADTDDTREIGLMCRDKVAPDRGMLFDFKTPQPVDFWMKNTLVPLDMLFIGADGRVISIARHATPLSLTPIPSGGAVLGVLEIAGDRAADLDIKVGDKVRERIFPRD